MRARLPLPRIILLVLCFAVLGAHGGTVVLKKAWIKKYKDRATIDGTFIVDHAHPHPNSPAKDGDLHASGRSQEVGLPMVSEVMNAKLPGQTAAVKALQGAQGKNQVSAISGAWRLWFEHPSTQPQLQFETVPPAADTNPDHCFEIHPVTKFGAASVPASFSEVKGSKFYDADTAFTSYEKLTLTLAATSTGVTLSSAKAGYNYVHFYSEVGSKRQPLDDGGFVTLGNIMNESQGDVLVHKVRLIFVGDTPPAKNLKAGEVHLVGIPRVSLNAIWTFLADGPTGQVKRKLPYEIIVVAILP